MASSNVGRPPGSKAAELDIAGAQGIPRRLWERSAKIVAEELEAYIKTKSLRPNPSGRNPSKPGEYPKAVTTEFVEGVNVRYNRENNSFRIYSEAPHGRYLQEGTKNMLPRPWATKALNAKDWVRRIAIIAREHSKR